MSELPRGWPERGSTEGRQGTESWRHDPRDRDADAERDAEAGETRSQRYRDHRRPRETQRSRCEDTWKECERDRDADRRRDKKAVTVDLEEKKAGSREQKQSEEEKRKEEQLGLRAQGAEDFAPPPRRAERTPGAGIPAPGPFSGSRLRRCGQGAEGGVWTVGPPGWEDGSVRTFEIRGWIRRLKLCYRVKKLSININIW